MKKRMITVMLITIIMMAMSTNVAAAKNPYTDVKSGKTVTEASWKAIKYVKNHQGFKGVISGKTFNPNKKITRGEFLKICQNLWGKAVVSLDKKNAKKQVSPKWACGKLTTIYQKIVGGKMEWSSLPTKNLSRADAARYIIIFKDVNSLLKPLK